MPFAPNWHIDPTRPQPPPRSPTALEAAIALLLRQLDEALAAYIATSGLAPAPATNAALGAMPERLRLALQYRGWITPRQYRIIAHAHGPGWSGRYVRRCDLVALEAAGLVSRCERRLDGSEVWRVTPLARELYVRVPASPTRKTTTRRTTNEPVGEPHLTSDRVRAEVGGEARCAASTGE